MSIHSTALVSKNAKLGKGASIGPFTIIHDNVVLGDNCVIESHCEIGHPTTLSCDAPLVIGANSLIRSHSTFYEGSTFGSKLITGHRVTVRENTTAGANFQIGSLSEIQGSCVIGDYVRTQSSVLIGQKSKIGNFVWMFPYVALTNDPHPPSDVLIGCEVADYAVIATMSVILPGVKVGEHALIAAHSLVSTDVKPSTLVAGRPAKLICKTEKIKLKDGTRRRAYPWPKHFTRGYPADITKRWGLEFN